MLGGGRVGRRRGLRFGPQGHALPLPQPHCTSPCDRPHHCPPATAALVSLALFGAYVTRAGITMKDASILDPEVRELLVVVFTLLCVGAVVSPALTSR